MRGVYVRRDGRSFVPFSRRRVAGSLLGERAMGWKSRGVRDDFFFVGKDAWVSNVFEMQNVLYGFDTKSLDFKNENVGSAFL